jgi:hypothetical protein
VKVAGKLDGSAGNVLGLVDGDATTCDSEICVCNKSVIVIRRSGIYCVDKHLEYLKFFIPSRPLS